FQRRCTSITDRTKTPGLEGARRTFVKLCGLASWWLFGWLNTLLKKIQDSRERRGDDAQVIAIGHLEIADFQSRFLSRCRHRARHLWGNNDILRAVDQHHGLPS